MYTGKGIGVAVLDTGIFPHIADDRLPIRVKADENSAVRWIPFADVEAEVREPEMRVVYRKLMDKAGC